MPSLNKVFLAGNLTRDPELRYTPGGTAVAQFGMAVNRRFRNREGVMQEEATFVDIEVWGRQAESANEYLSKGSPVLIDGRLKLDSWESKQTGERRSKLRVVGERVQFLGSRRGGSERGRDDDRDRDRDRPRRKSGPSQRRSDRSDRGDRGDPPRGGDRGRGYGGSRDEGRRGGAGPDAQEQHEDGPGPDRSRRDPDGPSSGPGGTPDKPRDDNAGDAGQKENGLPPDSEIPF